MYKYTFRIRARSGMLVENLTVIARDRLEAEKKLSQIYRNCEFLDCREVAAPAAGDGADFESVLQMINKQENPN
jgi:hypothetical protein